MMKYGATFYSRHTNTQHQLQKLLYIVVIRNKTYPHSDILSIAFQTKMKAVFCLLVLLPLSFCAPSLVERFVLPLYDSKPKYEKHFGD